MLHKMSILRHKSQLPSLPRSLLFPIGCSLVLLLADRHKYVQPVEKTLPSPPHFPLQLCRKADFGVDYEIRCGYSQLQHRVQYPTFLSEYSLSCTLCSMYKNCTVYMYTACCLGGVKVGIRHCKMYIRSPLARSSVRLQFPAGARDGRYPG